MKEAAGEANMTVITIVLIAIVLAVGTLIVNNMLDNTGKSSACQSAGGVWKNNNCYDSNACKTDGSKTECNGSTLNCSKSGSTWTCKGA